MRPDREDALRRLLWLRARITDDRGARRPVYKAEDRWWSRHVREDLPQEDFDAIREQAVAALGWIARLDRSRRLPWIFLAAAAPLIAVGLWLRYPLPWLLLRVVVVLGLLYAALRAAHRLPVHDGPLLRSAFLERRRCPICAADLKGIAAEDDGCRVCPECGAAWRIEAPSKSADRNGSPLLEGEG